MVDLYSPTQLVQVVNAVDVQKQLNALFTSLFFTRSVMFESRDIILDTIDDPNIPIAAFCSPMVGSKVSRDEGYESKTIRPGYMKPKSSIDPNKLAVRPAGVSPEQYNAFGARNIKVKQAIVNQAKAIRARIEWLAVQAITTGKNIIEGDGIERYELDWNIKPQISSLSLAVLSGQVRIKKLLIQMMILRATQNLVRASLISSLWVVMYGRNTVHSER